MKIKRTLSVFFLLGAILLLSLFPSAASSDLPTISPIELKLPCKSAVLIEQTTGQVLYEHNPDEKLPIASVSKIMTLLLTMEALEKNVISLDENVPISENAASMGGSQVYLEPGEVISLNDVLKAVFVSSANDGAVALAELVAGTVDGFVARMNEKAAELGMNNTVFYNPTGLDDGDTNLSSARDVAIMSKALLQYEKIYDYTTIWIDSIRNGTFGLSNTNKLVRFYPGTTGLKTGSTAKAKYCVSASAQRNGLKLCAVVLGGESSSDRFQCAKTLLDHGFANWSYYEPEALPFSFLPVWGGKSKTVSLYTDQKGFLTTKNDASGITAEVQIADELHAPVEKGQTVGSIVYKKGNTILKEEPILTAEQVDPLSFSDRFRRLILAFFGILEHS